MKKKSLIRFIEPGESYKVIGVMGKPVKRPVAGRLYTIKVYKGKKLVGFVNKTRKGKPLANTFSKSMLSRLRAARRVKVTGEIYTGKKRLILTNKRRVKQSVSKGLLKEIKKHPKKGFRLVMKAKGKAEITSQFYNLKGKISDKDLKNLVISQMLSNLNQQHLKVSPKQKGKKDRKKVKRVSKVVVKLEFSDVEQSKPQRKRRGKKKTYAEGRGRE
jgi:hypothetical protein